MSKYVLCKYFLKLRLCEVLLYVECPSKIPMLKSNSQCGGTWRWVSRPWDWSLPSWNQCPHKKKVPRNWPKRREVVLLNQAHSLEGCIWSSEGEWGLWALSPLLLCKDSARRQPSMKQEAGLTRHPICWHLDLGLLSLKLWEINFCYL